VTPEAAATRWLAELGAAVASPVDVDHLAEEILGLDIQEHTDLRALIDPADAPPGALSGLLLTDQERIYVNAVEAQRSPARRRFTIAHELGHWHLHQAEGGPRTRFCRPADVSERKPSGRNIEVEANRFAAALLMPEQRVRERAPACRFSVPVLAREFGVSAIAMQVRLEVLNVLPNYMRR
jgi:Zn-dependent peptidase ImmA (M78 family)